MTITYVRARYALDQAHFTRTLGLEPRADGRAWQIGDLVSLRGGRWVEHDGAPCRVVSRIDELLVGAPHDD